MPVILSSLAILTLISGCDKKSTPSSSEQTAKPVIYTTFYPTQYFAERIGGDAVKVVCPVPSDEDAIFWMPDSKTIQEYQKADMIIVNGAQFEKWVDIVSLPKSKIVNTAAGLKDNFIKFKASVEHSHGATGKHTHEGVDGHTWVDPVNARLQAKVIYDAMKKSFPDSTDAFNQRYQSLVKDLVSLEAKFKQVSVKLKNQPLLASHPAYNYVKERFKWNIGNLDLDPGSMPDDKTLADIAEIIKEHPAKIILWEGTPDADIAEKLKKQFGLESITFSPCELIGAEEEKAGDNYLTIMNKNLDDLQNAIQ